VFDIATIVIFTSVGAFFFLLNTYGKLKAEMRTTREGSVLRQICNSNLRAVVIALAVLATVFFVAVAYKATTIAPQQRALKF